MQLYYGSLAWIVLVMERWWSALGASENHDAPTFKISAPRSFKITPLRSHTLFRSLNMIGWAKFTIHLWLHLCVARQPLCWEPQPFLRNYVVWWTNNVFINIIHFICSVLFCETLLRIWNNRFIKAIQRPLSCYKFIVNQGFLGLIALFWAPCLIVLYQETQTSYSSHNTSKTVQTVSCLCLVQLSKHRVCTFYCTLQANETYTV